MWCRRTWLNVMVVAAVVFGLVGAPGVAGSQGVPDVDSPAADTPAALAASEGPPAESDSGTPSGGTPDGPPAVGGDATVASTVELSLTKTALPTTVAPGESVEYQLVASCSSLEVDCVDFTITDTLPEELEVSSLPTSNSRRQVTFDPDTRVLTVVYLTDLGDGQVGVPAGATQVLNVAMRLPAETPLLDGATITNEATVTSVGADPVNDDAVVTATIAVSISPVATKMWQPSSAIAGSGATSSVTVGVRSASTTSTNITDLVVADTTAATFDSFNLVSAGVLDRFPDGADEVTVEVCTLAVGTLCGDSDWVTSDSQQGAAPLTLTLPTGVDPDTVTGVRYRFTNASGGLLPRDPTPARITFDVSLRDTLRSSGEPINPTANVRIDNCATPTGVATDPDATATGPVVCAPFTILPGSVVVTTDKVMFADNNGDYAPDGAVVVGQNSGFTMRITGTNDSAFPVPFLRITEPAPATVTSFERINVEKMRVTFPQGATAATVDVTCRSGVNPAPVTLTPPPVTVEPPVGCEPGVAPESVTVTFTGEDAGTPLIAAGATAGLDLFGRAPGLTSADVGPAGLSNCARTEASSAPDGTGAAASVDCAVLAVEAPRPELGQGTKSTRGVTTITPGQELDFRLSFRNTGNIPLGDVVLVDPVDPTAPQNPFDVVRLTNLRSLVSSPGRALEVWDPTAGVGGAYVPYDSNDTALLDRARGIRVRLLDNLAVNQRYRIEYSVLLRDDEPLGPGAVPFRNCAAVGIAVASSSPFCSPFITAEPGGFGANLNKAIVPSQLLRPQPGLADQVASVRHQLANTGTTYLAELSFTDVDADFFAAMEFAGNIRVNFPVGANRVRVDVCTSPEACADETFVTGTPTSSQSPGLPTGVTASQVKGLRVTFTNSNGEFEILPVPNFPSRGLCPNATLCFDTRVLPYPKPGPGEPDIIELDNTSTGAGRSVLQPEGETFAVGPVSATLALTEGTPALGVTKGPDSNIGPGDEAPFNLVMTNNGTDEIGRAHV